MVCNLCQKGAERFAEICLKITFIGPVYEVQTGKSLLSGEETSKLKALFDAAEMTGIYYTLGKVGDVFEAMTRAAGGTGSGTGIAYSGSRNPASDFTGKRGSTLVDHFDRHGSGFISPEAYKSAASNFLEKPPTSTTQSFVTREGTYFRYDTATNEFGIMSKYGGVSTYYYPPTGINYWLEQVSKYAPK